MQVRDGGAVSTQSNGTGVGGPIDHHRDGHAPAGQCRHPGPDSIGQGGDVTLAAGRLFDLRNSAVTTSVAGGTGSGGNIFIDPPLMVLDNSRIEANAQRGAGGNITIRAGQLIRTPDSVIQASGTGVPAPSPSPRRTRMSAVAWSSCREPSSTPAASCARRVPPAAAAPPARSSPAGAAACRRTPAHRWPPVPSGSG